MLGMRDSDEVALHACRPAVDVSKKLCTGHVSSNTAQCECLKRRMRGREDGTTRSNIFPPPQTFFFSTRYTC